MNCQAFSRPVKLIWNFNISVINPPLYYITVHLSWMKQKLSYMLGPVTIAIFEASDRNMLLAYKRIRLNYSINSAEILLHEKKNGPGGGGMEVTDPKWLLDILISHYIQRSHCVCFPGLGVYQNQLPLARSLPNQIKYQSRIFSIQLQKCYELNYFLTSKFWSCISVNRLSGYHMSKWIHNHIQQAQDLSKQCQHRDILTNEIHKFCKFFSIRIDIHYNRRNAIPENMRFCKSKELNRQDPYDCMYISICYY